MIDTRGNPVSTRSPDALAAAERALWRMVSFYGTPIDDLAAAHAADPQWPLPLLMHAGFLLSLTEPSLIDEARALIERAESILQTANDRERAHGTALRTLLAGDWPAACEAWEALLLRHPRDALALQWAHLFDFYRGDTVNLRQRVARVLPEWDAGDALHPYVLGMHAFGLEECQLYAQAEATGRRALAGPAKVPWAIHAVAHVMEMQGRHAEGSAWMTQWHADWAEGNGFAGHLGWHHALFALEALDHAQALRRFDAHLRADPSQITLQRLDAAALLWRLHLLGVDAGPRWAALAAGWGGPEQAAGFSAFNDLHAVLALIGSGQIAQAQRWVQHVEVRADVAAEMGADSHRAIARDLGLPLLHGMLAFAHGRFDETLRRLYPLRTQLHRLGGSHAQRDLIDQTLMAAAAQAGERSVGRALLNERRSAKQMTPLTDYWATLLGGRGPTPH
jgi:hypothetical protein